MYEASFTINLAINNPPEDILASSEDCITNVARYAAEVALKVYFDDVRTLIHTNVASQLTPLLTDKDRGIRTRAHDRLMALSRWEDEDLPLSSNASIVVNLLHGLVDPETQAYEMPYAKVGSKPLSFFADAIVQQCTSTKRLRKPPFIRGGNFLAVARIAVEEILSLTGLSNMKSADANNFVKDALIAACCSLKINHILWIRDHDGRHGRPTITICHDVWLNLSATDKPPSMVVPSFLSRQQSASSAAFRASEKIQTSDPRGDWSAISVRLVKFHTVLHKMSLPTKWNIRHLGFKSLPQEVIDSYTEVRDNFVCTNPLEQLSVMYAIIACGLLPNIYAPSKIKHTDNRFMA